MDKLSDAEWLDFRSMAIKVTSGGSLAEDEEKRWDEYCRIANIKIGEKHDDDCND